MNYQDYKESRDATWDILINLHISELPVDILEVCRALNVKVKYAYLQNDNDGTAQIIGGQAYIFLNPDRPKARKRFTAGHELGHILLGHVGKYELVSREPSTKDPPIEKAANVFASRLLAPACVLWGLNLHTPKEIMEVCDISYSAAEVRAQRMEVLYQRNKFLTSNKERLVYNQFKEFIISHRHREDY